MPAIYHARMQDLGEDFDRFNQPRFGPVEEMIAVRQPHLPGFDSPQPLPGNIVIQDLHLTSSFIDAVATRTDNNDVGIGLDNLLQTDPR